AVGTGLQLQVVIEGNDQRVSQVLIEEAVRLAGVVEEVGVKRMETVGQAGAHGGLSITVVFQDDDFARHEPNLNRTELELHPLRDRTRLDARPTVPALLDPDPEGASLRLKNQRPHRPAGRGGLPLHSEALIPIADAIVTTVYVADLGFRLPYQGICDNGLM